jgi:hypothetical protein
MRHQAKHRRAKAGKTAAREEASRPRAYEPDHHTRDIRRRMLEALGLPE